TADSECNATQYCNGARRTCEDKLQLGERLPVDGVHTRCIDNLSNACESGNCADDRCTEISLRGGGVCSAGSVGTTRPALPDLLLLSIAALLTGWRARRRRA